ncbi:unnamed protein product [Meganyctiphanes norvegica]|uniref:Uncharacterized protein n=1 Tax=Meganyctiphanes norvegica TaxID=48144 RepID=A0AAV2R9A7_MEGNR
MIFDNELSFYNPHSDASMVGSGRPSPILESGTDWMGRDASEDTVAAETGGANKIHNSFLDDSQYVVGLSVFLVMIMIGMCASILMCKTLKKDPVLWSIMFNGMMLKGKTKGRTIFPRRVRFKSKGPMRGDIESQVEANSVPGKSMIVTAGADSDWDEAEDI